MDVVRNFIHVIGITPENELPYRISGQAIQYSDIETIYIPQDKPGAKNIFQIMIDLTVTSTRLINAPLFKTMAIEGEKKFKIIYTAKGDRDSANFITLSTPYNTFIELPKGCSSIDKVEVLIMDAYFSLLDDRKIYSYMLYLVHAHHSAGNIKNEAHVDEGDIHIKDKVQYEGDDHNGADFEESIIQGPVVKEMLISEDSSLEAVQIHRVKDMHREFEEELVDLDAEYL